MNTVSIVSSEPEPLPTPVPASSESSPRLSPPLAGALQSKNIRIHKRRTSIRLEPEMWNALNEIASLENCSIHDLCGAVHDLKEPGTSFTAALRVFLMEYYRSVSKKSDQVGQVQQKIRERSPVRASVG